MNKSIIIEKEVKTTVKQFNPDRLKAGDRVFLNSLSNPVFIIQNTGNEIIMTDTKFNKIVVSVTEYTETGKPLFIIDTADDPRKIVMDSSTSIPYYTVENYVIAHMGRKFCDKYYNASISRKIQRYCKRSGIEIGEIYKCHADRQLDSGYPRHLKTYPNYVFLVPEIAEYIKSKTTIIDDTNLLTLQEFIEEYTQYNFEVDFTQSEKVKMGHWLRKATADRGLNSRRVSTNNASCAYSTVNAWEYGLLTELLNDWGKRK